MSLLVRTAQIFSVFGAGATIPLTARFTKDRLKNVSFYRQAGGGIQQVKRKETNSPMGEAFKKLNEGNSSTGEMRWGCFWIPDFTGIIEIFFCFDQNKPEHPTLFHWKSREKKLNWVERITRPTTLQFKGSGTHQISGKLKSLLAWTQKWSADLPFEPSRHCTIALHNGKDYQLTCTNPKPDSSSANNSPWGKTISKSHIVDPSVDL